MATAAPGRKAALMTQYAQEREAHAAWLVKLRELAVEGYEQEWYCGNGLNTFLAVEGLALHDADYDSPEELLHDEGLYCKAVPDLEIEESWYTADGIAHVLAEMQARHAAQKTRVRAYAIDHRHQGNRTVTRDHLNLWFRDLGLPEIETHMRITVTAPGWQFDIPAGVTADLDAMKTSLVAAITASVPEGVHMRVQPVIHVRREETGDID